MSNKNKWAFSAITGYEGLGFGSADVENWQTMNKKELVATIEAQAEFYAPADLDGTLNAELVAETIIEFREIGGDSHEQYQIFKKLDA